MFSSLEPSLERHGSARLYTNWQSLIAEYDVGPARTFLAMFCVKDDYEPILDSWKMEQGL